MATITDNRIKSIHKGSITNAVSCIVLCLRDSDDNGATYWQQQAHALIDAYAKQERDAITARKIAKELRRWPLPTLPDR